MTLIIEDGSGSPDATSYGSIAGFRAYASSRGITLPTGEIEATSAMVKALDFLEAQNLRYQGAKVSREQALQWPRSGVSVDGFSVSADEIPNDLIYAQYALAAEALQNDLQPTRKPTDKGAKSSAKVGPITVGYAASKASEHLTPWFAKAEAHLSKLYKRTGLRLIRT